MIAPHNALALVPLTLLVASSASDARTQEPSPPVVTLDARQVESAGVRTAAAGPGRVERWIEAPAVAGAPTTATWHVNARLPGMVREVRVEPGDEHRQVVVVAERLGELHLCQALPGAEVAPEDRLSERIRHLCLD